MICVKCWLCCCIGVEYLVVVWVMVVIDVLIFLGICISDGVEYFVDVIIYGIGFVIVD